MTRKLPVTIRGIGVSRGTVYGQALVIDKQSVVIEPQLLSDERIPAEVTKLHEAFESSRKQIIALRRRVSDMLQETHAQIYDSHLAMLEDESIYTKTIERIEKDKFNAEYAFDRTVKELATMFAEIDDPYIRARGADLDDIYHRVMGNLQNLHHESLTNINSPVIIVARDLTPSDTANMIGQPILAFVTDKGGPTSHTAIMAKALEIPAVVSTNNVSKKVETGDQILVDGKQGFVVLNPDEAMLADCREQIQKRKQQEAERLRLRDLPAETRDGFRIELAANIEFREEIPHVKTHGADGVGLFRTEFQYLNKEKLPSEEELFEVYRQVVTEMAPKSVIFRTMDLGGDKLASFMTGQEMNPYMGLRAIRLCLKHPEMFRTQLRALLRATADHKARLMFPMVTRVEEIREARKILAATVRELRSENKPVARSIRVGTMIEIPSAALTADILAREVDFFSIGTNDLIQYTLAVDRGNQKVASLYDPLHPSVLRLIQFIIDKAHEAGIWVGVCGEMASDPVLAALLVGMGIDELSMGAVVIPEVKALLRSITLTQARELAKEVMRLPTGEQIREAVEKRYRQFRQAMINDSSCM